MEIGLFPCRRRANKRLLKLWDKKVIERVAYHAFGDGHATWIYGPPVGRMAQHQIDVTRVWHAYRPQRFAVGSKCQFREDLTMITDEVIYRVEIDTGSERKPRLSDRFDQLSRCDDIILFLAPTPARIVQVKEWAEAVNDRIYFGITDEVIKNPLGPVYQDIDGAVCQVDLKPGPTPES